MEEYVLTTEMIASAIVLVITFVAISPSRFITWSARRLRPPARS